MHRRLAEAAASMYNKARGLAVRGLMTRPQTRLPAATKDGAKALRDGHEPVPAQSTRMQQHEGRQVSAPTATGQTRQDDETRMKRTASPRAEAHEEAIVVEAAEVEDSPKL